MEDSTTPKRAGTTDYCAVVRKKYRELQTAMQNPSLISSNLSEEGLISGATQQAMLTQKVKASAAAIAIDAVLSLLEVSKSAERDMTKFCKALEKSGEPSLLILVAEMRKEANICQSPNSKVQLGSEEKTKYQQTPKEVALNVEVQKERDKKGNANMELFVRYNKEKNIDSHSTTVPEVLTSTINDTTTSTTTVPKVEGQAKALKRLMSVLNSAVQKERAKKGKAITELAVDNEVANVDSHSTTRPEVPTSTSNYITTSTTTVPKEEGPPPATLCEKLGGRTLPIRASTIIAIIIIATTIPFTEIDDKPGPENQNEIGAINWTSPTWNTYLTYLNKTYQARMLPEYFKGPNITQHKPNKFINLALVHKEKNSSNLRLYTMMKLHGKKGNFTKTKAPFTILNIGLIDQRKAKYILVEGAPGVGKTTLAWHLCYLWSVGELLQQWSVVVMIQLRQRRFQNATALHDLIDHPELHVREFVVDEMKKTNGTEFLLIFEGYDELSKVQLSENSIFQSLLRGKVLPEASIMVTSQSIAIGWLPKCFRGDFNLQHIEVLGFEKEYIDEYIKESCANEEELLQNFMSYLSNHPFLYSIMYNPFHCAIITDLYIMHWKKDDKAFAPKTLTELYTVFTISLIKWELSNHGYSKSLEGAKHITDLPENIIYELLVLGKIAADGIEQSKYVFDNVPKLLLQGFLHKAEDIYSNNKNSSYSFLHLTVQEYFAALYWSQNLSSFFSINANHFRSVTFNYELSRYVMFAEDLTIPHWHMLLFIAGLTKLVNVSTEIFKPWKKIDSNVTYVHMSLCQLLLECQCTQFHSEILRGGRHAFSTPIYLLDNNTLLQYSTPQSDLHEFSFGYCVAHSASSCLWELLIYNEKEIEMVAMGIHYLPFTGKGGTIKRLKSFIESRHIFGLHPHTKELDQLEIVFTHKKCREPEFLEQMPKYFEALSSLTILYQSSLNECWPWIAVLPKMKNLVELKILFSKNDTEIEILSFSYQLKHLLLVLPQKQDTDILSRSLLKIILPLLATYKLEYLLLQHFNLSSGATAILSSFLLSSSCSVHTLELRLCTFSSKEAFQMFATIALESKCLRKIISDCDSLSTNEAFYLASTASTSVVGTLEAIDLREENNVRLTVMTPSREAYHGLLILICGIVVIVIIFHGYH